MFALKADVFACTDDGAAGGLDWTEGADWTEASLEYGKE